MPKKTCCFSSFHSEPSWREKDFASFALLPDEQADHIVEVMDEMQYAFCPDDEATLLTNLAMNQVHLDYLHSLGLRLENEYLLTKPQWKTRNPNAAEALFHAPCKLSQLQKTQFDQILTYSVVAYTREIVGQLLPGQAVPALDTVKKVNSKCFSTLLGNKIGDLSGEIVTSSDDILRKGLRLLDTSPLLIKDPFGVSGAGNIRIDKPSALQSIVRFLHKQELAGRKVTFILEPFYEKERDFSSLFTISREGKAELTGIEWMENKGFGFSKIYPAPAPFVEALLQKGYLEQTMLVIEALIKEGYWGPVCIDSMLLANGSIRLIVEINARHSMGFLNERMGKKLNQLSGSDRSYQLATLNVISRKESSFDTFFEALQHTGLLYQAKNGTGIFPLSANTWDINHTQAYSSYKKRFYYMTFYRDQEELNLFTEKLNHLAQSLAEQN